MPRVSDENSISAAVASNSAMGIASGPSKDRQDSSWTVVGAKNSKKTAFPTFRDNKNVLVSRHGSSPVVALKQPLGHLPNAGNTPPSTRQFPSLVSKYAPLVSKHAHGDNTYHNDNNNNSDNVGVAANPKTVSFQRGLVPWRDGQRGSQHPVASRAPEGAWARRSMSGDVAHKPESGSGSNHGHGRIPSENLPPLRVKILPGGTDESDGQLATFRRPVSPVADASSTSPGQFPENGFKYIEPRFVYDVNCVVFVGNVAPSTTQDMLSSFFSQFGLVKSVNLKNAVTGRNRKDYAFIKFLVPESVTKVLSHSEPLELDGAVLEVRPRAGNTGNEDFQYSHLPSTTAAGTDSAVPLYRTILVENIPSQWSPQFFFQCFTAYGKPTGCFIYDDTDSNGMKRGLIEMKSPQTAAALCQNTGFLLLPNNATVKVTLTSVTNFDEWVKMQSQWLMYQQLWSNYSYGPGGAGAIAPGVGAAPTSSAPGFGRMGTGAANNTQPAAAAGPPKKKIAAIVKASNVEIKAFKNSDEIFETFKNLFGDIDTSAIASIDSEGKAVVIFKVADLDNAKQVKKDFDWYTFPGSPPEIDFP